MRVKGVSTGKVGQVSSGVAKSGYRAAAGIKPTSGKEDDVQLSATARLVGMAGEAVAEAPDIRTELVEPIRDALASGRYDVDSIRVADKILRQVLLERKISR